MHFRPGKVLSPPWAAALLAVAVALCWTTPSPAQDDPAADLSADQQRELATLGRILRDEQSPYEIRKQMASLLLNKKHSAADAVLIEVVGNKEAPQGRLAVIESIAATPPNGNNSAPGDAFVDPLFDALGDANEPLRKAAARAMIVYKGRPEVLARLRVLMLNTDRPLEQRLGAVEAFSHMPPSRGSIDPLIQLLDAKDATLRARALDALDQMTLVRIASPAERRLWWEENRQRSPLEWVNARNVHLSQENARLHEQGQQLEKRLIDALTQLYQATAEPQQADRITAFLSDSQPAVRVLGLRLIDQHLVGKKVPEALSKQAIDLLGDESPRVRSAAAILAPYLGDAKAVDAVLGQLVREKNPTVRLDLIRAAGRLRAVAAGSELIKLLDRENHRAEAAEAARALGSIAARGRLDPPAVDPIANALVERFAQSDPSQNELREALLTAMADIAAPRFRPILVAGLADEASASIRLASARGLGALAAADPDGRQEIIDAIVARLSAEADRGVRLELIGALGRTGPGRSQLEALHVRTNPTNESDESIRRKAWETLATLIKASERTTQLAWIRQLTQSRGNDPAAAAHMIDLLLAIEQKAPGDDWPVADRLAITEQLADLLAGANRWSDAAPRYLEVYRLLVATAGTPPARAEVAALRAMKATLQANQSAQAVALLKERKGQAELGVAMVAHLRAMLSRDDGAAAGDVLAIISQVRKQVPAATEAEWRGSIEKLAADARKIQDTRLADQVAKALDKLAGTDKVLSAAARKELEQLGLRAVPALLDELEKSIDGQPNPTREKAIVSLLSGPPIEAKDYDPAAEPDQKKTLLAAFRQRWAENNPTREN